MTSAAGAGHGSELLYLFGPTAFRLLVGNAFGRSQQRLAIKLRGYWTSFVKDGSVSAVGGGPDSVASSGPL